MTDQQTLLVNKIVEHEGLNPYAYQDSLGYWTIGIGTLIDNRAGGGLTVDECFYLFNNRLKLAQNQLEKYNWYKKLDEVRQGALAELAFNLGIGGLLKFKKMINALTRDEFDDASKELINSLWAKQVGLKRSDDIAYRLAMGKYK